MCVWKNMVPGLYAIFVTTLGLKLKVAVEVAAASATVVTAKAPAIARARTTADRLLIDGYRLPR